MPEVFTCLNPDCNSIDFFITPSGIICQHCCRIHTNEDIKNMVSGNKIQKGID